MNELPATSHQPSAWRPIPVQAVDARPEAGAGWLANVGARPIKDWRPTEHGADDRFEN